MAHQFVGVRLQLIQSVTTKVVFGFFCVLIAFVPATADESFFTDKVAPLFESKCLNCHSDNIRKGEFSLTSASDLLQNGFLNTASAQDSHLIQVVQPVGDEPAAMPLEGDKLTLDEINILKKWIADGASWPDAAILREKSMADNTWWSLQPWKPAPVPQWPSDVQVPQTPVTDIDHFIARGLSQKGLQFSNKADRQVLIRRAYYDLTGLPPTPEDVHRFVADNRPDAFQLLVDDLLNSKHYGERWGRHWLDVVRFGESNGFERNVLINELWPFRDYVIQSINDDKPFDQLMKEHLAGDVLADRTPQMEIGSAFLVAGPYDNVGNQDAAQQAQIRANTIDEMIRASSEAFLGLTVGCARCHDHKFDPILQADYYSLYSTFASVRHGARSVASDQQRRARKESINPLQEQRKEMDSKRQQLAAQILKQVERQAAAIEKTWQQPAASRTGTEDRFPTVIAKFVRLTSEGQDSNPADRNNFRIDEFEVWSALEPSRNVALKSNGATASGASRRISDFPGAYGPELAIDGLTGRRFIANQGTLTIEFAQPESINRVVFSSAKGEPNPDLNLFIFVSEYRLETSMDGQQWTVVATSKHRKPVNEKHRLFRLERLVPIPETESKKRDLDRQIAKLDRQISAVPSLPRIWVGTRDANAAKGPFHVFIGGDPQRKGAPVTAASLTVLRGTTKPSALSYQLESPATDSEKRLAFANWVTSKGNPLTPRVLANRIWHYHFGTGIVSTPGDFGYMGSQPSHPELLDWLASKLLEDNWKIKDLHRTIMQSATYQQASAHRADAASVDADSRLLWRFPMRRLSAEEIRDSMLAVSGLLRPDSGGPGFRLYDYLQDNVATYVPLDQHGKDTYRRAIYHQNARASVVDLMTEFDQPDCAFASSRRSSTTTPLQALTTLNHSFTLDMASALAERLEKKHPQDPRRQISYAFELCFGRRASTQEVDSCLIHVNQFDLASLCRVLLNTSEMIYVR